jgi:hypothetical protein
MAKTKTYMAVCKKCQSPVYYYPAKLLLESSRLTETPDDLREREVVCTCTGENDNGKHTLSYSFPKDFTKI